MNEIAVLQKHITNYLKTKDVYAGYRELLTYQANLSGLFGIENAKTEPQKERQQKEK
jgi:hypothetical protein